MKRHPEQRADEIFWGNVTEEVYQRCPWETKRRGQTPLMRDGSAMGLNDLAYLKPLFVQRAEVEEALLIETDQRFRRLYQMLLDNGHA